MGFRRLALIGATSATLAVGAIATPFIGSSDRDWETI